LRDARAAYENGDYIAIEDYLAQRSERPERISSADAREFMLAEADDFDAEVEALRANQAFQEFLSQRALRRGGVALENVERELDALLARQA